MAEEHEARYGLYWVREDRQGDLPMGRYETPQAAEAAIPECLEALLVECGGEEDRRGILAGSWLIRDEEIRERVSEQVVTE